jgi:hypothetical protein
VTRSLADRENSLRPTGVDGLPFIGPLTRRQARKAQRAARDDASRERRLAALRQNVREVMRWEPQIEVDDLAKRLGYTNRESFQRVMRVAGLRPLIAELERRRLERAPRDWNCGSPSCLDCRPARMRRAS